MTAFTDAQLKDIQGFGIAGFLKDHQESVFVRFGDPAGGRRLLEWLASRVASAWEVTTFNAVFSEIRTRTQGAEPLCATWTGMAISAAGYQALGVALTGLPAGESTNAFSVGMAARSTQIGDTGAADAPAGWLAPFRPGAGVHLVVVLAADEVDDLDEAVTALNEEVWACGCQVVFQERGETLPPPLRGHEHFGFKDGISQPAIDGYDDPPATGEPAAVPPGEFVLGYPNASGASLTPSGDLWSDGAFVVFRRLHQDVAAFRAQANTGVPGSDPALTPSQTAAAMVGRWPSGAPLELNPTSDPGEAGISNAFAFKADPFDDDAGMKCPHFAHIRKAFPRDETTPSPDDNPNLHRMLRRGIPYGPVLDSAATADDGTDRGLHFYALVADLDRQFEFVQRQWLNSPNFPTGQVPPTPGGPYAPPVQGTPPDGPDPVVGESTAGEQCLLIQASGKHPFPIASQLVRVTAGEYFFLPSLTALAALAGGATQ